jgi:hypothetical protein
VPLSRAVVYWAVAVIAHMTVNIKNEKRDKDLKCMRLRIRLPVFLFFSIDPICASLHPVEVRWLTDVLQMLIVSF